MSQVCPKRCCHHAASRRQPCQPALESLLAGRSQAPIAPRSQPVFARSRQLLPTIVASANPATVKTYSAALNAAPGEQGCAVKLAGGVA